MSTPATQALPSMEASLYRLWKITEGTKEQLEEVEHVCVDLAEPAVPAADLAAAAIELAKSGIPLHRIGESLGTVVKILSFDRGFSSTMAAELVGHGSAVFGPDGGSPILAGFVERVVSAFLDAR